MTPQERQLVADLFERLAALESQPRDAEADAAIRDGLAKAPHAVYALVQTVLVQDEALKQADAHIQELEAALQGGSPEPAQPRGFLDNMRDALFGRDERAAPGVGHEEPRGSVPSVRPGYQGGDEPMGVPPQYRSPSGATWGSGAAGGMPPGGMAPGGMPPGAMAPEPRGGSFLGTAAAAAAGVIGGGLLLDGIRGMLGGRAHHGPFAGAFDDIASGRSGSPWGGSERSELAREAGIDDIGRDRHAGLLDRGNDDEYTRTAGLVDDGSEVEDAEYDDGTDADSDDTDYA
jgi:hypothetical protein